MQKKVVNYNDKNKVTLKENTKIKEESKLNKRTIAIALYTVNKLAKKIRDLRNVMKGVLFNEDDPWSASEWLYEQSEDIINLCSVLDISFDPMEYSSSFPIKKKEQDEEYEKINDDFYQFINNDLDQIICMENDEYIEEIKEAIYLSIDIHSNIEKYKDKWPNDVIEIIKSSQYFCKILLDDLNSFIKRIENLHERLHDLIDIQDALYELKSSVIDHLGLKPVAYHELSNSIDAALAYYEFDGFKFHLPVKKTDEIIIEDIAIDLIASENTLSDEDKMTIDEALKCLTDFIGGIITPNEILSGITNWSGLNIFKPEYQHRTYADDEYNDYDEYDDYYDEDFGDDYDDY